PELNIGVFVTIDGRAGPGSGSGPAPAAVVPGVPLKPGERLFSRSQVVHLADLPEFEVKDGQWPFAKDGTLGDPKKSPIKVKGFAAPKGLGMHPPAAPGHASVKYRLGKQAAVFKTTVAIDDTANFCWTPAVFTVWGDGKQLF